MGGRFDGAAVADTVLGRYRGLERSSQCVCRIILGAATGMKSSVAAWGTTAAGLMSIWSACCTASYQEPTPLLESHRPPTEGRFFPAGRSRLCRPVGPSRLAVRRPVVALSSVLVSPTGTQTPRLRGQRRRKGSVVGPSAGPPPGQGSVGVASREDVLVARRCGSVWSMGAISQDVRRGEFFAMTVSRAYGLLIGTNPLPRIDSSQTNTPGTSPRPQMCTSPNLSLVTSSGHIPPKSENTVLKIWLARPPAHLLKTPLAGLETP